MSHPISAAKVAHLFLDNIIKLRGWPSQIVSDRDPIFMSAFWTDLFKIHEVELLKSTAFHPQTDGQSEALNKVLEGYLRCVTGNVSSKWVEYLSLAEYWYNTKFHSATRMTPFEALYGYPPTSNQPLLVGDLSVQAVDHVVKSREEIANLLHANISKAQNRMNYYADLKRTKQEFNCGDWVYLKIQPYKQHSIPNSSFHKLVARYYGPFRILEKIRQVAYRLELPEGTKIHDVFHVSLLKKHHGGHVVTSKLPNFTTAGDFEAKPLDILDRRMKRKGNRAVTEILVHWTHTSVEDATWHELYQLQLQFPHIKWSSLLAKGDDTALGARPSAGGDTVICA